MTLRGSFLLGRTGKMYFFISLITSGGLSCRFCRRYSLQIYIIEGDIPKAKQKLVEAWIEIHKEELSANWVLLVRGEQFFKIDPLK